MKLSSISATIPSTVRTIRPIGPPVSVSGSKTCFLGCIVPFGYRRGEHGQLAPHKGEQAAIREMVALRAQGRALRAIAAAMQAKGFKISHEGVKGVVAAHSTTA
jgi:hypothetical protein